MRRAGTTLVSGSALGLAARKTYRLLTSGALTLDVGRRLQPLGPLLQPIRAPQEVVFDVISGPYLGKTPRALVDKLQVWERGSDMVLAAHFTEVKCGITTTLETVRFQRPDRIDFCLVRGRVPHLVVSFLLTASDDGAELCWQGELGTDLWDGHDHDQRQADEKGSDHEYRLGLVGIAARPEHGEQHGERDDHRPALADESRQTSEGPGTAPGPLVLYTGRRRNLRLSARVVGETAFAST